VLRARETAQLLVAGMAVSLKSGWRERAACGERGDERLQLCFVGAPTAEAADSPARATLVFSDVLAVGCL
jgi:hypothetical protein